MVENTYTFVSIILLLIGVIIFLEEKKCKIFNIIPGIVFFYALIICLSCFQFWNNKSTGIEITNKSLVKYALCPLIFLIVMNCDIIAILKIGKKLLLAYIVAVTSIMISFSVTYFLMSKFLPKTAWMILGSLSGSWMGGAQNMVAVKNHIGLSSSLLGNALITDTCAYSLWVCFLLITSKWASLYNKNVKATPFIEEYEKKEKINILSPSQKPSGLSGEFILLLGLSFFLFVPISFFFKSYTTQIILTISVGLITSFTPMRNMKNSKVLANYIFFILIGGIAAQSNINSISTAPLYVLSGLIILVIHAILLYISSKLFRLDLFSVGVASLANIGGIATASILAKKHDEKLLPIGAILAMISIIFGYFYAIFLSHILFLIHISVTS